MLKRSMVLFFLLSMCGYVQEVFSNESVVKVRADAGHGSGFVVDRRGVIVTNHHVVENTRYLGIQFVGNKLVPGEILKLGPEHDLALVKVHPDHLLDVPALPLGDDPVMGDEVIAMGSPLSQDLMMTQGIVSRSNVNSVVGDFLIEGGNSGGPLLNHSGQVVGINTFGLEKISGAVKVSKLKELLDELDWVAVNAVDVDVEPLPLITNRYPISELKKRIDLHVKPKSKRSFYVFQTRRFTISATTPVSYYFQTVWELLKSAENRYKRRGRKIHDSSYSAREEIFYSWLRDIDSQLDEKVTFHITPKIAETWGSILGGAALQYFGVPSQRRYSYMGEFWNFEVVRDGEIIEPVHPGRVLLKTAEDNRWFQLLDMAYAGMYSYRPEDFMTGREFVFRIYGAKNPLKVKSATVLKENTNLIINIRGDFSYLGNYWRY